MTLNFSKPTLKLKPDPTRTERLTEQYFNLVTSGISKQTQLTQLAHLENQALVTCSALTARIRQKINELLISKPKTVVDLHQSHVIQFPKN